MGIFVAECADLIAHHDEIARLANAREAAPARAASLF